MFGRKTREAVTAQLNALWKRTEETDRDLKVSVECQSKLAELLEQTHTLAVALEGEIKWLRRITNTLAEGIANHEHSTPADKRARTAKKRPATPKKRTRKQR